MYRASIGLHCTSDLQKKKKKNIVLVMYAKNFPYVYSLLWCIDFTGSY